MCTAVVANQTRRLFFTHCSHPTSHYNSLVSSIALLLKVVGHYGDLIDTAALRLELAFSGAVSCRVNTGLIFGEESDNESSVHHRDSSTATRSGQLSDIINRVMSDQHILLAADANASLRRIPVSLCCAEHTIPLIDVDSLRIGFCHAFNFDLGGLVDVGEAG